MAERSSLRQSPLALVAGLVVLVAALTWLVGWALPLVLFLIIAMVMGHEFGHFITAKRAGLLVTDFFVGFGPVVWSIQKGETRYGVRALLLGGYVKVPGMTWGTTVPPEEEARTYRAASYPKKVLFASAGSLMHLLMALVLAWAALSFVGHSSSSAVGVQSFSHWQGHKQTAAQLAGLKIGDQILSVDGRSITSISQLIHVVTVHPGDRLTLLVDRKGTDLTLHVTPVAGQSIKENGQALDRGTAPHGYIGIGVGNLIVHSSLLGAIPNAVTEVGSTVGAAYHALVHVFSPGEFSSLFHQVASPGAAENPVNQATRPVSIVGVTRIAVQAAQAGPNDLLLILMAVNIFVGVLNMLPMLPLDGGYVAVATYERIRSRRSVRYQADVNKLTPVIYAFMSVLLVLFACTLFLDIAHPIANPFG